MVETGGAAAAVEQAPVAAGLLDRRGRLLLPALGPLLVEHCGPEVLPA